MLVIQQAIELLCTNIESVDSAFKALFIWSHRFELSSHIFATHDDDLISIERTCKQVKSGLHYVFRDFH